MEQIAQSIKLISDARGSIDKTRSVGQLAKTVPGFKEVLRFIYNPYIVTGIAKTKLYSKKHNGTGTHKLNVFEVMEYLEQHQTGSDVDVAYVWVFINQQETAQATNVAMALVTKDLQIGINVTTLNKIFGNDFIPKIGVMLGTNYEDVKSIGPYIVTEKLDGHRRIIVKEHGKCTIYTRSGHIDSGLVDVEAEFPYLTDNLVYDSEFLAIGNFVNSIEQRQATSSIMSSGGVRRGVTMNVFDMIDVEEFKYNIGTTTAITRKIILGAMFKDPSIKKIFDATYHQDDSFIEEAYNNYVSSFGIDHEFRFIKPVPILGYIKHLAEAIQLAEPIWERGYEGVMLNTVSNIYQIKRSTSLLKVKRTKSYILKIVDMMEGDNKYTGMLGAFVVDYKGNLVGVGSGLTDDQRVRFWAQGSTLLGTYIEIESFGESVNKQGGLSLNAPIFKRQAGAPK